MEAMSWWPHPGPTPATAERALRGTMILDAVPAWDGFIAIGTSFGLDPSRPKPDGSFARSYRGDIWRSADGRTWDLLPDRLIESSDAQASSPRSGLIGISGLDGRPLLIGSAEQGITFWLGPTSLD